MREIEFRVWDTKRNKFCNQKNIVIDCHNGNVHGNESRGSVDEWIIEQFTGKRDKTRTKEFPNGKKIYEGDICKGANRIYVVEYIQGIYGYKFNFSLKKGKDGFFPDFKEIEIIGNIHGNRNLLDNNSGL